MTHKVGHRVKKGEKNGTKVDNLVKKSVTHKVKNRFLRYVYLKKWVILTSFSGVDNLVKKNCDT